MARLISILLLSLLLFISNGHALASHIHIERYGLTTPLDTVRIRQQAVHSMDSMSSVLTQGKNVSYFMEKRHLAPNRTLDFYLLLLLCLLLGIIRFSDPHYFQILLRAFQKPTTNRHYKEQIQSATISNFLMNVFFAIVAGTFIYYASRQFYAKLTIALPDALLLTWLIAGMLLIYLVKYFVIRFSGWVFKVETITEQYLFNVFLINKIVGIVLLPFLIIMAFADSSWVSPLLVLSMVIIGLLLFNRYARSWQVFSSFFQYSRFHFFTYLCASEILPMAILVKAMLRALM